MTIAADDPGRRVVAGAGEGPIAAVPSGAAYAVAGLVGPVDRAVPACLMDAAALVGGDPGPGRGPAVGSVAPARPAVDLDPILDRSRPGLASGACAHLTSRGIRSGITRCRTGRVASLPDAETSHSDPDHPARHAIGPSSAAANRSSAAIDNPGGRGHARVHNAPASRRAATDRVRRSCVTSAADSAADRLTVDTDPRIGEDRLERIDRDPGRETNHATGHVPPPRFPRRICSVPGRSSSRAADRWRRHSLPGVRRPACSSCRNVANRWRSSSFMQPAFESRSSSSREVR